MKIKDYKCKCGHNDFFFANKGNQKGIYCSYCGKWLKWADKDEQNLIINKELVLAQIRAEIEQKARPNELGGRENGKSIRYGLCMALEIIDKYKTESEEKE